MVGRWSKANISIALQSSWPVVVDYDSATTMEMHRRAGLLSDTLIIESQPGHRHCDYRRPAACPELRVIHRGQVDILANGIAAAPPSRHQSGRRYAVVHDITWDQVADLPELPPWFLAVLEDAAAQRRSRADKASTFTGDIDGETTYARVRTHVSAPVRALIQQCHTTLDATRDDRSEAD